MQKQNRQCKAEGKLITVLNCGRMQARNKSEQTEWKCQGCEHQGCAAAVGRFERWCQQMAKDFPPGVNPYFCVRKGSE